MVEIYIHFLADQKICISIDLYGAQVNKQDGPGPCYQNNATICRNIEPILVF